MSSSHNPLELGQPISDPTAVASSAEESVDSTATTSSPLSASQSANAPSETATSSKTAHPASTDPTNPVPPRLHHTRTAPTTYPVHPVAHQGFAAQNDDDKSGRALDRIEDTEDGEGHSHHDWRGTVPLEAGGLHGQPMPGSHAERGDEPHQVDHQAGTTGGRSGHDLAMRAAADLGLQNHKPKQSGTKTRSNTLEEKQSVPFTKINRTATGTHIHRSVKTGGRETVQGYGMMPIVRQPSLPPAVGPFGGTAPTGIDAEEGLWAVRSHEEELERQKTMDKKGVDPFAVKFVPGDPTNPKNWGIKYRWFLTIVAGLLVLNSTFASSAPSGVVTDMQLYFGFSREVGILTIALFVAGYMLGPLLWGPLSEIFGRRPIFIVTFIAYIGFQVGCALSKNTASILVFRFLGGTFAAAPLTNSGALIADIWDGDHRGQAMSLFALAPFAGPAFGPIVAGYISVSGTSWRWVFWVTTIFASVCLIVIIFAIPETYSPAILVAKAARIRTETGDDRYYAPLERAERNLKSTLEGILLKPFVMLALEPMLLATTLYMSYIYGIVYLLFEAFPFVFVENHGFNVGENGLCFLGFFTGGVLCVLLFVTVIEPRYLKYAHKLAPQSPQPEKRLELCIISGWTLVVAMFWFGWTSYPSIHWISPVLAGGLIGFSVLGMFVSLFNYVIDTYLWSAASALAGMTVVRSAFGAGFPLFASQMYEKLGTQWASALLGFLALVMAPIPMVLFWYGPKLRARSRYSPSV